MRKLLIIVICALVGCSTPKTENETVKGEEVKYAKGFHFETIDGAEHLVVDTPWPNAQRALRYNLSQLPKTFVCTSTSHLPYFEMLEAEELVVGFPNVKYISSKVFNERAKAGLLRDLGPDDNLNLELLIEANPQAVIAFDMGGESRSLDKFKETGIPVYYNSDFLEESPLGRAEWIKFFGALLNKRAEADSIFQEIELSYLSLKSKAQSAPSKPTIFSGVVYGDTWFLPGGKNWAAIFYEDAGGGYLWSRDSTSGWLELSFESVYETANSADFWIGTSTINSKEELLGQDERYGSFRAFNTGQVFSYNKVIGPHGGYDFFESGYSRPDLVLSDLIKVLHPELLPNYETVYFQKLP